MDLAVMKKRMAGSGQTPEKWLKWIVQFINKNLDTLTEQEQSELAWGSYGILKQLTLHASAGNKDIGAERTFWLWVKGGGMPYKLPQLQSFLRATINALVDQGQVNIDLPAARLNIQTMKPSPKYQKLTYHAQCIPTIWLKKEGTGPWGYHLGFLLSGFGHRLRRCRVCNVIFFASRQDQFVCGRTCINARGQRVWRDNLKKAKSSKAKTPRKTTTRKGGK